jgi:uncharacterized protein YjcR
MDLDELNTSTDSGYTTDDSTGGKKHRKTCKKKRGRKSRESRKTRKQRGGTCFGNGVGANNSDPNNSIYNTNALSLFPYRPN